MIQSFMTQHRTSLTDGTRKQPGRLVRRSSGRLQLDLLDSAGSVSDLRLPPGNRLEALTGDRDGQFSIRINQQYRICFEWTDLGPERVEIVDYH